MPRDVATIAETLRAAIQGSGRSFAELGKSASVAASQLSRFVAEQSDLNLETAGRLCRELDLSLVAPPKPKGRPKKS